MSVRFKAGGLPPYGMPIKNEIGEKPERKMMGFPGMPMGEGMPPMGEGMPGMPMGEGMPGMPGGPGGPGGPNNDPTDDPKFPRSFKMIPTYVIENNKVTAYPLNHQLEGTVGDTEAKNIKYTTDEKFINGIVVKGGSKYTISDSYFKLDGQGVNDFEGIGAAVMVTDDGELTVDNCYIETNGVIRPCVAIGGTATLHVNNCDIHGNSGPLPDYYDPADPIKGPGMMEPPAGLFMGGTCRTHLSVGTTKTYYKNTNIVANSWAALSTDNGRDLYLEAENCDITVENVGYGVYADGGCNVVLKKCDFNTVSHGGILAGDFTAKFLGCDMKSQQYVFMCHDLSGGVSSAAPLEIRKSDCQADDTVLFIKSHNIHADIEKSDITGKEYAVRAIVNNDPDGGVLPEDAVPYGNKLYISESTITGAIANDDVRDMSIILENSRVNGPITGAYVKLMNSNWLADKDSSVALVDAVSVSGIDALPGVTITAVAASGTTLKGEYALPSGGKLIVE